MTLRKFSNYLIYVSLIFLVIYLVKKDYVALPENINYLYLLLSFLLMFLGFSLHGMTYSVVSKKFGLNVSIKDSIIAFGLYVFSRYIPGKVWVLIGPVSYFKDRYHYATDRLLTVSVTSQFINLWIGLTITSIAVAFVPLPLLSKILCVVVWLGLTLTLYTRIVHDFTKWVLLKTLKKEVNIPHITFKNSISTFPIFVLCWIAYTSGFFFFSLSFGARPNTLIYFAFPLASIIGMIAVFIPGGLGVREGALVVILLASKVPLHLATSISMASRVWFLIGELFIFVIGVLLKMQSRLTTKPSPPCVND